MLPAPLIETLRNAQHIVVFTGAGVSAESGIPTFRDSLTGLWERFDAASLARPEAFCADPELVWGWYEWRRMKVRQAQPNPAHQAIVELAQARGTGARGLRSILENVLNPIMFDLPSRDDIAGVTITGEVVTGGAEPLLLTRDEAKKLRKKSA